MKMDVGIAVLHNWSDADWYQAEIRFYRKDVEEEWNHQVAKNLERAEKRKKLEEQKAAEEAQRVRGAQQVSK